MRAHSLRAALKGLCLSLALWILLLLGACSSGSPVVEEENRILVASFAYAPAAFPNGEAAKAAPALAGHIVYALQSAGVPAALQSDLAGEDFASPGARLEALKRAAGSGGFDYVVDGSIAEARVHISPAVTIGGAARGAVRAELSCAFQLIHVKSGNITKAGAAKGREDLALTLESWPPQSAADEARLAQTQHAALLTSARKAALKVGAALSGKSLEEQAAVDNEQEIEEERSYYQDSPGKRRLLKK